MENIRKDSYLNLKWSNVTTNLHLKNQSSFFIFMKIIGIPKFWQTLNEINIQFPTNWMCYLNEMKYIHYKKKKSKKCFWAIGKKNHIIKLKQDHQQWNIKLYYMYSGPGVFENKIIITDVYIFLFIKFYFFWQ